MAIFTRALGVMLFGFLAVNGQTPDERVFRSVHTNSVQELNELATVIRAMGGIREVAVDTSGKTIAVRGTPAQIAFADWLFAKLDQPSSQGSGVHEYTFTGAEPLHAVRLIFIKNAAGIQEFQQIATLVRSLVEVRHVFTYNASKGVVFRGTPEQMAAVRWLIAELDRAPASGPSAASGEFRMEGEKENVIRIFYLTDAVNVQDFQESATGIRSMGDIRRVFTYNAPKALAIRGTAAQLELADWLVSELNRPVKEKPAPSPSRLFNLDDGPENTVQVFRFPPTGTVAQFIETAKTIRAHTSITRLFPHAGRRVLAVRGTPDQVAQAERLINAVQSAAGQAR